MLKLSDGEIETFAGDIYETLEKIPLHYVYEVLELANERRQREFEIDGVDITSSDEEDGNESSSEEEEESSSEESSDEEN